MTDDSRDGAHLFRELDVAGSTVRCAQRLPPVLVSRVLDSNRPRHTEPLVRDFPTKIEEMVGATKRESYAHIPRSECEKIALNKHVYNKSKKRSIPSF